MSARILLLSALLLALASPAAAAVGDLDSDTDVDVDDIAIILAAVNTPAGPADPKDLDSDGTVTALDARVAVTCCTRPLCARGNNPPSISDQSFSVDENSANSTGVGTVVASDPDAGQSLTFAITGGNTGGAFAINATTGEITVANSAALDFETTPSFALTVEVTDDGAPALASSATVTIDVTDVNEAPAITSAAAVNAAENQTSVIDVQSTDPEGETEGGGGLSYSLTGGADQALFSIDAASGVLTFDAPPDFENPADAGADNVYDVQVTVTDSGLLTGVQNLQVTVTDVNDPPVIVSDGGGPTAAVNAPESQTSVTDVQSTDADGDTEGAGLTYSLTGGADQPSFSIAAATGVLTFIAAPDFENPADANADGIYEVTVTVTDSGTLTDVQAISVTVTDQPDPPMIATDPITYATVGCTQLRAGGPSAPPAAVAFLADAAAVHVKASIADQDTAVPGGLTFSLFAAPANGTVDLEADGTFTYVPNPTFTGATDSFQYQVTDGATPLVGTVNVGVSEMVRYVHTVAGDTLGNGNTGCSDQPFDNLTDVGTVSTPNDFIYVFEADTGTTALDDSISLKAGQKLHGEGIALDVPGFAGIVAAGNRAAIDASGGDAVTVLANAADANGVEIRGLDLAGSGNAVDVTSAGAFQVGVTIADNHFSGSGAEAVDLNPGSSGAFVATIENNTFSTASPTGNAIDVVTGAGAGNVEVAINDNTDVTSSGGAGIRLDGTAGGQLFVTGFAGNSVHGNTAGTGIEVFGAIFDSDPADNDFDLVAAGTTTVGTPANPVGGAGVVLGNPGAPQNRVSGNLSFARLDVAAAGAGFAVAGSGPFVSGPPDAGLQLGVTAGTAVANGGPAVALDPLTANPVIFDQVVSAASPTSGVSLVAVDGVVTLNDGGPGSAIAGSSGTAFDVDGGTATVTYHGVIDNAAGFDVEITNRPAAAGDVTFTGAIGDAGPTTGQGIFVDNNLSGNFTFGGPVRLDTAGFNGVRMTTNAGAAIHFEGGLAIDTTSGTAFLASGGGTVNVTDPATNSISTTGTGTALSLVGVTIGTNNVIFDSITSVGSGGTPVFVANVGGGTLSGGNVSVNGTGPVGTGILLADSSSPFTFASIAVDNAVVAGLRLQNNSGAFQVAGPTTMGAASGNTGDDISIFGGTGGATFASVDVDRREGRGVIISNTDQAIAFGPTTIENQNSDPEPALVVTQTAGGSVTFQSLAIDNNGAAAAGARFIGNNAAAVDIQGGSITGAGGTAFDVDTGAAPLTMSGTITNVAGRSVSVTNRTGGTVLFNAAIDDDGTGIFLDANGAGTVRFRGGLALDTGADAAFTATNGGIVEVCATADCAGGAAVVNTIGATTPLTATAVNVVGATIGGNDLSFRSIAVDGDPEDDGLGLSASTAIVLNGTGGGQFLVTGVGSTAGSGGTIEDLLNDGVTLDTTGGLVTLRNMILQDIGATGGAARSQHDAIHGETVAGGLTLDGLTIRRISDQGINGATFGGAAPGVGATTWNGLRILNSLIENTNRYQVANTLDNLDEGAVRINGLIGTVEIDNSEIRRAGRLFEAFTATSGMLDMTVQRSDFSLSYKETATVTANLGMRIQVEGTTDAVIRIGDPQETVNPALGNDFLNVGLSSLLIQGGVGASGNVAAVVAQNTFTVNDHDAPIACCNFPQGGVVLAPQVGQFGAIFANNTFTTVANAGGRDGNLVIVADRGTGEIIVRNNVFNAPFNGAWEVLSDGFNDPNVDLNVLFDSNTYNNDPAFLSPDVGVAFNAPGFHSDAFARNGGDLTLTIRDEDHAPHETRPGLCIACATGTLIFEAQASGGTMNLFLDNVDAPNGFDLNHSGGTFNMFQGVSASAVPQTILDDNGDTGGDAPPGTNSFPGTPGRTPPEVNVGGVIGTITIQAGTPSLPNPIIP